KAAGDKASGGTATARTATGKPGAAGQAGGPARPSPSMMAPHRRPLRSKFVPLSEEVWTSSGEQTPFDVGQQYAAWWYEQAASEEKRDQRISSPAGVCRTRWIARCCSSHARCSTSSRSPKPSGSACGTGSTRGSAPCCSSTAESGADRATDSEGRRIEVGVGPVRSLGALGAICRRRLSGVERLLAFGGDP